MFCLFFFIGNHYSRYDQSKMRSHLIQCFNYSKMERFPSEMVPSLPIVKKEKIKLYCTCRVPHLEGENMAHCPSDMSGTMVVVNKYLLLYFPI